MQRVRLNEMQLASPRTVKRLSTHSGRLERWLGADRIQGLSNLFLHGGGPNVPWFGSPVTLLDVPGSVAICGDGDFVGDLGRGFFASAADSLADHFKRIRRELGRPVHFLNSPVLGAGFASIQDLIDKTRQGYGQWLAGGQFISFSIGSSGSSLCTGINLVGAAAPGGTALVSTDSAYAFNAPPSGTLHLIGGEFYSTVDQDYVIVCDNIFGVAKTMSSNTTEAVTGVPTRYQSATVTDPDYAGDNFIAIVTTVVLVSTAHNWTVCQYTNQAGTTGKTLPSVPGSASAIAATIMDQLGSNTWFCALASGDVGVKAITQMQCSSALVSGGIKFGIYHPLGVMASGIANQLIPHDWATKRQLAPRIFDNACIDFLGMSTQANAHESKIRLQAVAAP